MHSSVCESRQSRHPTTTSVAYRMHSSVCESRQSAGWMCIRWSGRMHSSVCESRQSSLKRQGSVFYFLIISKNGIDEDSRFLGHFCFGKFEHHYLDRFFNFKTTTTRTTAPEMAANQIQTLEEELCCTLSSSNCEIFLFRSDLISVDSISRV